jgi:hypothetical protein
LIVEGYPNAYMEAKILIGSASSSRGLCSLARRCQKLKAGVSSSLSLVGGMSASSCLCWYEVLELCFRDIAAPGQKHGAAASPLSTSDQAMVLSWCKNQAPMVALESNYAIALLRLLAFQFLSSDGSHSEMNEDLDPTKVSETSEWYGATFASEIAKLVASSSSSPSAASPAAAAPSSSTDPALSSRKVEAEAAKATVQEHLQAHGFPTSRDDDRRDPSAELETALDSNLPAPKPTAAVDQLFFSLWPGAADPDFDFGSMPRLLLDSIDFSRAGQASAGTSPIIEARARVTTAELATPKTSTESPTKLPTVNPPGKEKGFVLDTSGYGRDVATSKAVLIRRLLFFSRELDDPLNLLRGCVNILMVQYIAVAAQGLSFDDAYPGMY